MSRAAHSEGRCLFAIMPVDAAMGLLGPLSTPEHSWST
jgi:hypothetical protein